MSGLILRRDASLEALNGFGLEARARRLALIADRSKLPEAVDLLGAEARVLGLGSNVLFTSTRVGDVLHLRTTAIAAQRLGGGRVRITAESGIAWHELVLWSVARGLHGIENLALIPGSVGAAPIQNIGAYGMELERVIEAVEVYDRAHRRFGELSRQDCAFGYRDSRFKRQPQRYVVTALRLILESEPRRLLLDYAGVAEELAEMAIDQPRPADVAAAVMRLRRRKLPDPARLGNLGSFFKNPIVPRTRAADLVQRWPALPHWPVDTAHCKLSAAWLIESLGFKGQRLGAAGVYERHALVLVNHGAARGEELLALARRIIAAVEGHYGVRLEIEPDLW